MFVYVCFVDIRFTKIIQWGRRVYDTPFNEITKWGSGEFHTRFNRITKWGSVFHTRFNRITEWGSEVFQREGILILFQIASLIFGISQVGDIIEEEKLRGRKEEHVILIGKHGSGIDLVGKALIGKDYQPHYKVVKEGENNGIKMSESLGKHDDRDIKITSLHLKDTRCLSTDDLSALSISEDYSVVFCFPITYRFTKEDLSLLETYLKYRQSENYQKISIAFTHAEHLDSKGVEHDDYIENLPDRFTKLLTKCSNKYYFIRSKIGQPVNNDKTVIKLLKPLPGDRYHDELLKWGVLFYLPLNNVLHRIRHW